MTWVLLTAIVLGLVTLLDRYIVSIPEAARGWIASVGGGVLYILWRVLRPKRRDWEY